MAYIEKVKGQYKSGIDVSPLALDGGLNRYGNIFNIAPNETQDCFNIKVEPDGVLTLIKEPKALGDLGIRVLALGVRSGKQIHVLCSYADHAEWRYTNSITAPITWTTIKNDLPPLNVQATFVDFQTSTNLYTVLATGAYVYAWDGTTVTALPDAPKTNKYCVDDYRLYAAKDNLVYMTEKGSLTWLSSTIPLTGARGVTEGIVACNDKVYCFTQQTCHILYGDDANNYSLSEIIDYGCMHQNAVIAKNGEVYFVNINGLHKFTSAGVVELSKKINLKFNYGTHTNVSLISLRNKIYLKYDVSGVDGNLYIFDEDENKWFYAVINSETNMVKSYAHALGEKIFDFYGTGFRMINHDDADTTTSWYHVTPMTFQGFNKQIISSIPVLYHLPTGSTMKLYYNTNSEAESWTELYTFENTTTAKVVEINIPLNILNNVDFYNLKFSGTGDFKIYYIGTDGRVKFR